ncbi:hypothetical protein F4X10_22375 [Candidatus Poribacteria bacterium]|nr:hypothetical protein [Candidatus Poribacteria bacterium]
MKNNIRSKIKRFLESEDGRVSAKAPLALGVATGSVLLAQTMVPSPVQAGFECADDSDCDSGEGCFYTCSGPIDYGTCLGTWSSKCMDL